MKISISRSILTTVLFISVCLMAGFISVVYSATLEVGAGKAYSTIQSAIIDAGTGDIVLVNDGTYIENINFLGKAITVKSVNGAIKTIIDGGRNGTVVTINYSSEEGTSILDGFRLTNADRTSGSSYLYGGGIYCYSAKPIIKNCIIANNRSDYGGGIYCELCLFARIDNCTITNNWAMSAGGGIYLKSSPVASISKCIISNNLSSVGAGLNIEMSSPSITNCFIVRNQANYSHGGGIACYSSSPSITNCTISDNSVSTIPPGFGSGGGISCFYGSEPIVQNSILWGNYASDAKNIYLSENNSIKITYSDIEGGWVGQGNIHSDPRYVDTSIEGPDYHLTVFSPCINKGTSAAPANDIDNDLRPQGKGVDMGADEVILKCPVEEIYGENSEQTELLREYRDNVLSKTPEGQELIKTYYKFSPAVTKLLEQRPLLKNKAKAFIDDMLPGIRKKVNESNKDQ